MSVDIREGESTAKTSHDIAVLKKPTSPKI